MERYIRLENNILQENYFINFTWKISSFPCDDVDDINWMKKLTHMTNNTTILQTFCSIFIPYLSRHSFYEEKFSLAQNNFIHNFKFITALSSITLTLYCNVDITYPQNKLLFLRYHLEFFFSISSTSSIHK